MNRSLVSHWQWPKRQFPYATVGLVLLNVLMALVTLPNSDIPGSRNLFDVFGFIPKDPRAAAVVSSLFLHADAIHLLTNMIFLWVFASHVESAIGLVPTLLLYLAGGVTAVMTHWAVSIEMSPVTASQPLIGASGAVASIIGYFALRYYRSSVKMMFGTGWRTSALWIPVWVAALVWIGIQSAGAISSLMDNQSNNIGYWAHLGGFGFGMIVGALWRAGNVGERESSIEQAEDALRLSNPATALNYLRPLLLNNPEDAEVLAVTGAAWEQLGDRELMGADWAKAIRFGIDTGQFNIARECAIRMKDRHLIGAVAPTQRYRLGCLCFEYGDPEMGVSLLESIIVGTGYSADREHALIKLADYYLRGRKSPERAHKLLERFLTDYPGSIFADTAQGWIKQFHS